MTNKPKTIADALAEVQLKVNEDKRMRAAQMAETYLDEAGGKAGALTAFLSSITKKKPAPGTPGVGPQPQYKTPNPVPGTGPQPGYNSPVGSGQPASGARPGPSTMSPQGASNAPQPQYKTPNPVPGTGPQPGTSTPAASAKTATPAPAAKTATPAPAAKPNNTGANAALAAGAAGAGALALSGAGDKNPKPPADGTISGSEYGTNPRKTAEAPTPAAPDKPAAAPLPPRRPAGLGTAPAAPAPRARADAPTRAAPAAPAKQNSPGTDNKYGFARSGSDEDTAANFFAADKRMQADKGGETEDGGKTKGKKKISESMIEAFLALQNTKAGNVFEAAKKLKGNQDKLDKNHNGKLDKQDFKMLRGEKMEEAAKPDFLDLDKDGNKKESMKKAAKDKGMKEESIFSEAEIEHIASILEVSAPRRPDTSTGRADKVRDGVPSENLTDEVMSEEEAAKRGRGRPAGSKSGSKHGEEGAAETMRVAAQVRTARPYFSGGKEVHDLKHPTTGKTYQVGTKAVNDFNQSYAAAERPHEKDSVENAFVKKHMS
jgi:hypothetical protein